MRTNQKTRRIQYLNDRARTALGVGGMFVQTPGIGALPLETQSKLREAVEKYDQWEGGNDPYHEHDFGAIEVEGVEAFWKIDYYDKALEAHSPDPADTAVTERVLTLMLREEY